MWHLSSPTRDQTHSPCIGSTESKPLDHQRSPCFNTFSYTFFLLFKQEPTCFHFAMSPENMQPALVTLVSLLTTTRTAGTSDLHSLSQTLFPRRVLRHGQMLGHVWLFAIPLTVARQVPLSVGFPRQEYCSGLSFTPPGDLPDPGIESVSLTSPALASRFFTTSATENYPEEAVSCSYVLNPYGWERESLAQSWSPGVSSAVV